MRTLSPITVRPAATEDRQWIGAFLDERGSGIVARRGELLRPGDHPMLIAEKEGAEAGLLTYVIDGDTCEILTLHAVDRWAGAGTALVTAIRDVARAAGCRTLWVLTTNDNVDALRFYQRRGFRLAAFRPGAVDAARRTLKPSIADDGEYGIPLRDEIELTMDLV